jgi:hypothetical protein
MGHAVTMVDAYGPGNGRAASGGETRQIRVGYGDQEIYSRWVLRALEKWKAREQEFGESLLLPTGRLQLASGWTEELSATKSVFEKLGVAHEVVPHDELSKRHPQMRPEGVERSRRKGAGSGSAEPSRRRGRARRSRESRSGVARAFPPRRTSSRAARGFPKSFPSF